MIQHDDILDLPGPSDLPRLVAALRDLERPASVPTSIDDAILGLARPTAPLVRSRRAWVAPLAAAAAALLVVGVFAWRATAPERAAEQGAAQSVARAAKPAPGHGPAAPAIETGAPAAGLAVAVPDRDLNADGVVDIIDAYLLARRIEGDRAALDVAKLDQDADGALTRADVDAIAMIAVALPGRAR